MVLTAIQTPGPHAHRIDHSERDIALVVTATSREANGDTASTTLDVTVAFDDTALTTTHRRCRRQRRHRWPYRQRVLAGAMATTSSFCAPRRQRQHLRWRWLRHVRLELTSADVTPRSSTTHKAYENLDGSLARKAPSPSPHLDSPSIRRKTLDQRRRKGHHVAELLNVAPVAATDGPTRLTKTRLSMARSKLPTPMATY